jgi:pimeloyl-ACP methyl ester carboxylesterase
MKQLTVGSGPARALVVHGYDLGAEFYLPLAERLAARGLPTTLVTLPGFDGEPPLAAPGWTPLVDAIVAALPPAPATLVGHSLGGLLALLAAARRPPSLSRLVLLEPVSFPWRWLARLAAARYLDGVVRGPRDGFVNSNGLSRRVADLGAYPPAALELHLAARRRADRATGEALFASMESLYPLPCRQVEVPCLVVVGRASGWRARWLARRLARRLPRVTLTELPRAAHFLLHEADDALADAVSAFISAHAERGGS